MEFLVLGPVEVRVGRAPLGLGGPRPRAVLADLLVHAGSVLSTAGLIDDLWGAAPPPSAEAIVQNSISRLRKSLGRSCIDTVSAGYVLTVDPGSIDAHRFERLLRDARPLPAQERVAALRDALALWRGPAYSELAFEGFLQGEIARLDELRLTALEDRLDAEIELGLHDRAGAELEALATQEPGRERLRRLQMLALHRAGRTQDALDVYEQVRRAIDDLSGLEPSAETKALQIMILRDDPLISAPAAAAAGGNVSRRPVALLLARVATEPGADLEATAAAVTVGRHAFGDAVVRHGGVVLPAYGTESVAVFGAEIAHDDDVLRAGRAAIEAREIVRSQDVAIRFAIGVGRLLVEEGVPLILGDVADEVRLALDAAEAGDVVVSRSASAAAGGAFSVETSDGRVLLGAVLTGRRPTVFSTRLVGRDAELAHLEAALRSAVEAAAPAHFVVVGEPGIGKTRLIHEFAAGADALVLSATCVEYGEGITFHPLRELAYRAASLDPAAPLLADLSAAEGAFSGARDLVQHFLESGPVVLLLDDLHWAMPTLLDLVEYLPQACRGPLLVVSATRPELLRRRPAWGAHALALEPLSAMATRTLIETLPTDEPLTADVVDQLVVTSDGLPLFAEQLVAFARTELESTAAEGIPPSLEGVLVGRLDSLEPGERAMIQHASVIGARFERSTLAALTDPADVPHLDGRLAALERSGLLQPRSESWHGFSHALVRDAAYHGIPKAGRAESHERVARHLDLGGTTEAGMAAVHLEAAALLWRDIGSRNVSLESEAGHRLATAGFAQWQGGDAPGAANLLGRACAILEPNDPRRIDVSIELALALRDLGEHRQAATALEESLEAARHLRRRRPELRILVESIVLSMSLELPAEMEAEAILRQALPVFRRARDDRAAGRALLVRAFLASVGCRFAEAEEAAEDALEYLVRAGYAPSKPLLVIAASALHGNWAVSDARDRCEALHRRAEGHSLAQANVDLIRALIEGLGGEADRARELLEQATEVFGERGQRLMLLTDCCGVAAELELLAGDLEHADALLAAAAGELGQRGEPAWAARHDALRAEIAVAGRDTRRAILLARQAAARNPSFDLHANVTCMRIEGKALAAQGDGRAGRRLIQKALAALEGTDALELRSRVLLDLAEVECWSGGSDVSAVLERASAAASAKGSVALERRAAALRQEFVDGEAPGEHSPGPR